MATIVVEETPLLVVMHARERRRADGLLDNPPELFVVGVDQEKNVPCRYPISWGAARTLVPKEVDRLGEKLRDLRHGWSGVR